MKNVGSNRASKACLSTTYFKRFEHQHSMKVWQVESSSQQVYLATKL